jgi:hypothetical protein
MMALRFGLLFGLAAAAGCGRSAPFALEPSAGEGEAGTLNVTGSGAGGSGTGGAGTGGSDPGGAGSSGAGGIGGAMAGTGGSGTAGSGVGGVGGFVMGGSAGEPGVAPDGVPSLRVPRNGASTGSVFAARSLTPAFAWTPVDGATEYEIEIDDTCPASGFDGCSFPSPEQRGRVSEVRYQALEPLPVSRVAPVGTRYFWRVRACSGACGAWSSVRYVDVGRQRQDLDGDGYADVWRLRTKNTVEPGVLDVYFGPPPFVRRVALRGGPEASGRDDNFGHNAEAVGDANLDGYSDLAVGAPRTPTELTVASTYLFFGGPELAQGLGAHVAWHSPSPLGFGSAIVVAGDVNADGASDFAAGGYWRTPQSFSLLLGGSSVPMARHEISPAASQASLVPVSGGDLDGDGYSDLLAVETDLLGNEQMRGVLGGGDPAHLERLGSGALPAASSEQIAAIGDVNGDGFVERVAFTLSFADEGPVVDVMHGSPDLSGERARWYTGVMAAEDVGMRPSVRTVVNAGDLNADGLDDTAALISFHYSALIDVVLFFGGEGARDVPDLVYRIEQSSLLYVSGGTARAAGDTNGDGFDDLLIVSDWDELGRLFLGGPAPDAIADHVLGE